MCLGGLQDFHGAGAVGGHGACEEVPACAEAKFSRVERVLHRAVGRRLADEAARRSRGVLSFRQTVDAVVQQDHVDVHVAADGMDEVVAADGQAVAVARNLPYGDVRVGHLEAGGDGRGAPVDGLHGVGVHIVRKAAGAADAGDDGRLVGRDADFGHGLV